MQGRDAAIFQVAATYVGTVVGAGFASGQEALRFFSAYGPRGLLGLALATVLLCLYGVLVLDLGRRLGATSHREVLLYLCGPRLGPLVDAMVTAFLLAILGVMIAGGGAIAAEQWGLPAWAGAAATALATLVTVLAGLQGVMGANTVVVPVLTLMVTGLTAYSLGYHRTWPQLAPAPHLAAAPHWAAAGVLYAAYNLVLSVGVLAPLGAGVGDRRALVWGGIMGGVCLGLLGLFMVLALAQHLPEAGQHQIPMLHLARYHPAAVQVAYTVAIWAEIYTTAVASAFGLTRWVAVARGTPPDGRVTVAVVALAAAGAPLGFSRLVEALYPAMGAASLVVLALLAWRARRGP